mmetsp:Transcript_352/g.600  ORF Transcript_352/g.600 Transcript_352/m.600 type:complete len:84 (+) Transcript_352:82-333(+)
MGWDGHELAIVGTATGAYGVANGALGKGWVKSFIHRQPVAAFSVALGCLGILLPLTVIPLRRKLGLPTNQYDAHYPGTVFPKI